MTCTACNNRFGSLLEGALADWCFGIVRHAQAAGDPVPGQRRIPSLLLRTTDDGKPVWIAERPDPAMRDMLASGGFTLSYALPHPNLYRLAALKHAYLAACLSLQRIPQGPYAERIRSDLLGARNARDQATIPISEFAAEMPLMRSYAPPAGPVVALAIGRPQADPDGAWQWFLSLAGVLLVAWPLPDNPPDAKG